MFMFRAYSCYDMFFLLINDCLGMCLAINIETICIACISYMPSFGGRNQSSTWCCDIIKKREIEACFAKLLF